MRNHQDALEAEHDANTQRIRRIRPGYLGRLHALQVAGDEHAGDVLRQTLFALDTRLNDLALALEYGTSDLAEAAIRDELDELEQVQRPLAEAFLDSVSMPVMFLRLTTAAPTLEPTLSIA